MKFLRYQLVGSLILCLSSSVAIDAGTTAAQDAEGQATELVKQMTLDEKLSQLQNTAAAIPRLGIPAYQWWSEALHGAVSRYESTDFPEPIALAATFDSPLVHEVADAISQEVRALHERARVEKQPSQFGYGDGLDVWAPNINIFRDPRWGRGQETYGEDPFLTARMGVAFITGMQGPDPTAPHVIATPKHFAVHSGPESTRHQANVTVSAHDLEDTYLPAFQAAIVEAHAGSIMCAYNSINGQPACANDFLLKTKLRGEWGFRGYVVSDCDALRDIAGGHHFAPSEAAAVAAAIKTGVDNECIIPLDPAAITKRYAEAVKSGQLPEEDVDRALIRLFAARIRVGALTATGHEPSATSAAAAITPAHRALALQAAEESVVLLKNNGALPWQNAPKRILVTGPLADNTRVLRGNYSSDAVQDPVSVLAGLKSQFAHQAISYVPAGASATDGSPVPRSMLLDPQGKSGITAEYFGVKANNSQPVELTQLLSGKLAFDDKPMVTMSVHDVGDDEAPACTPCKAVFSGVLVAPETGTYRVGLQGLFADLTFEGSPLAAVKSFDSPLGDLKAVRLEKGKHYPFQVSIIKTIGYRARLIWQRISDDPEAALREAAGDADAIIAVVGLTSDLEGEEAKIDVPGFSRGDRTTLDLPSDQQRLLQVAKESGKPLIVVSLSGSAVNLSWAKEHADAILQGWYPGEEGGTAIARILAGATNPSGRLPVTFYADVASLPPFEDYSMKDRTYRYYDGTPVYPFGYGLSYTTFNYGKLDVQLNGERAVTVRTTVANTGKVEGQEVAQLYLRFPDSPGAPRLALRGFARVRLKPGEKRNLTFELGARELSSVSDAGVRRVLPGRYELSVGAGQPQNGVSSTTAEFHWDEAIDLSK